MKKAEKTEITKDRILKAAIQEFGTKGYSAASLNNICSTGISKGLLYHNFENKDVLYLACIGQCFKQLTDHLMNQEQEMTLHRYMDARLHFFQEHPNLARLFFESTFQPPDQLLAEIRELQKDLNGLNRQLFQNVLKTLTLRPGVTKHEAMEYFQLMQSMFHGYFNSVESHRMDVSDTIEIHESSLLRFLDFMLYGIVEREESK